MKKVLGLLAMVAFFSFLIYFFFIRIPPLRETDFTVDYKKKTFQMGDMIYKDFEKLGPSSASKKEDKGFLGFDKDGNRLWGFGYPKDNPEIFFIKRSNVKLAKDEIILIDISLIGSKRGIKVGDSLGKIKRKYGEPFKILNSKKNLKEKIYIYINKKSDKALQFNLEDDLKVRKIYINFNDYDSPLKAK